jgi:hypothetical protein
VANITLSKTVLRSCSCSSHAYGEPLLSLACRAQTRALVFQKRRYMERPFFDPWPMLRLGSASGWSPCRNLSTVQY